MDGVGLLCLGIGLAGASVFWAVRDWNARTPFDNALMSGATLLAIVIGLLIAVDAVRGFTQGDEPARERSATTRREAGRGFNPWAPVGRFRGDAEETREAGYAEGVEVGEEEARALEDELRAEREDELLEAEVEANTAALQDELEAEEQEATENDPGTINPYPIKKDGEPSYEFEPEDIERAEEAPPSVRAYCAQGPGGTVSEAQEVGCLSHVTPSEVP